MVVLWPRIAVTKFDFISYRHWAVPLSFPRTAFPYISVQSFTDFIQTNAYNKNHVISSGARIGLVDKTNFRHGSSPECLPTLACLRVVTMPLWV